MADTEKPSPLSLAADFERFLNLGRKIVKDIIALVVPAEEK